MAKNLAEFCSLGWKELVSDELGYLTEEISFFFFIVVDFVIH